MNLTNLDRDDEDKVMSALRHFGYAPHYVHWIDVCESGQVFVGLTEILPRGSVNPKWRPREAQA